MTNEQIQALKAAAEKIATGHYTDDQWFHYLCLVHQSNILSLLAEREADKALIAEQEKRIAELEISCDRNYVEGMKTGWNYCDADNGDGFNACVDQREKDIRDARAAGIPLVVGGEDATK